MTDPTKQPGLVIKEIFLTHSRFQSRPNPVGQPGTAAEHEHVVSVTLSTYRRTDGRAAAVAVRVLTTPESKGAYQFDVEMGAVVEISEGEENLPPDEYVRTAGGALLYPFLREHVANLSMRAKHGALWLRPFNLQVAANAVPDASAEAQVKSAPSRVRKMQSRQKKR